MGEPKSRRARRRGEKQRGGAGAEGAPPPSPHARGRGPAAGGRARGRSGLTTERSATLVGPRRRRTNRRADAGAGRGRGAKPPTVRNTTTDLMRWRAWALADAPFASPAAGRGGGGGGAVAGASESAPAAALPAPLNLDPHGSNMGLIVPRGWGNGAPHDSAGSMQEPGVAGSAPGNSGTDSEADERVRRFTLLPAGPAPAGPEESGLHARVAWQSRYIEELEEDNEALRAKVAQLERLLDRHAEASGVQYHRSADSAMLDPYHDDDRASVG